MTPSSKNFEKILEQSPTSQIDHLKVLRKSEVLRWTYLTVQTSRSFRATGHDLFDQPSEEEKVKRGSALGSARARAT